MGKTGMIVLQSTLDFYRYIDFTPIAEYLYECIEKTILACSRMKKSKPWKTSCANIFFLDNYNPWRAGASRTVVYKINNLYGNIHIYR